MKTFEEDLAEMQPTPRTYALIGYFMEGWWSLELMVNMAVEHVFGLDFKQGITILSNVEFGKKILILRTALHESLGADAAKPFNKTLNEIAEYSKVRNMVAHTPFYPSVDGAGVLFTTKKANGTLQMPIVEWSVSDFFDQYEKMLAFSEQLKGIFPHMQEFQDWSEEAMVAQILPSSESS